MNTTTLMWFKSSYSGTQGDDCVEIAVTQHTICVRDSKDTDRPHLAVAPSEWTRFLMILRSSH